MAKHNVYLDLPLREVNKVDAHFHIFRDDAKMGRITVSKGGIEYFPSNSKKPIRIGWIQFDKMVKDWNKG